MCESVCESVCVQLKQSNQGGRSSIVSLDQTVWPSPVRAMHRQFFVFLTLQSVCLATIGGESPFPGSCDLLLLSHWLSGLVGRGLVGLFEGFEERGVLGNDMILERGRQQQHQQKQLNKTTTITTTTNRVLGGWSVQQDRVWRCALS